MVLEEGGREGGRQGGREGGREGKREGGRGGGREGQERRREGEMSMSHRLKQDRFYQCFHEKAWSATKSHVLQCINCFGWQCTY